MLLLHLGMPPSHTTLHSKVLLHWMVALHYLTYSESSESKQNSKTPMCMVGNAYLGLDALGPRVEPPLLHNLLARHQLDLLALYAAAKHAERAAHFRAHGGGALRERLYSTFVRKALI